MDHGHIQHWNRREVLRGQTLAETAGLLGLSPEPIAAEPPPETTRIRLIRITGICVAPQYIAEDLLRAEGFSDVEYVPTTAGIPTVRAVVSGAADIMLPFVAPALIRMDAGDPLLLLGGIHGGYGPLLRPPLHEVGMIASSPQKIIAQGTDWRFPNELKKEPKG